MAIVDPASECGRRYRIYLTSVTFLFDGMAHTAAIGSYKPLEGEDLRPDRECRYKVDWPKSLMIVTVEVERASVLLAAIGLVVVDGDPLPLTAQQMLKRAFDMVPGFRVVASESTHGG